MTKSAIPPCDQRQARLREELMRAGGELARHRVHLLFSYYSGRRHLLLSDQRAIGAETIGGNRGTIRILAVSALPSPRDLPDRYLDACLDERRHRARLREIASLRAAVA